MTTLAQAVAELPVDEQRLFANTIDVHLAQTDFRSFTCGLKTIDQARKCTSPWPSFDKYTFLADLDDWYIANRVGIVGKTRQLFVSYYFMTRMLWHAWCSNKALGSAYEAGVVSQRLDDAVKQMYRIRQMYHSMSETWKAANPLVADLTERIEFKNGGRIQAYPASAGIGHSLSLSEILLDETAFLPYDREMWGGLMPTIGDTGRLYAVSTPNGEFNLFHDLWHSSKLPKMRLHYLMHPQRKTGWKEKMKPIIDPTDDGTWDREQEFSFLTMVGERVYKSFRDHIHVTKIDFEPTKTTVINRGFDFGYRHPACVWSWINARGQRCILKEYGPTNTDIFEFVDEVVNISKAFFSGCGFRNFPDPAGKQRWQAAGKNGERCALDVLATHGITDHEFTNIGIDTGLDIVRQELKLRQDGQPGLLINEQCVDLIKAMKGGYHYPDKATPDEKPFKDHFYDDYCDADRYAAAGLNEKLLESKPSKQVPYEDYAEETDEFGG